jgi:hypothetical protein
MNKNYNFEKAEKILNAFSFFANKETKMEKAMEYYKKALRDYILLNDYLSYAVLSEKIGDEYIKLKDEYNALCHYKNAEKYYFKLDVDKFTDIVNQKIIPLEFEKTNLREIAKLYEKMAICLKDYNHEKTPEYFEKAIEYFTMENSPDLIRCYKEYIGYLLEKDQINLCVKYLDLLIRKMSETQIFFLNVCDHIFTLLLCVLVKGDTVLLDKKIQEYCDISNTFANSQKFKFILDIKETYENNQVDEFIKKSKEYDELNTLKTYEVKLLLKIKEKMLLNDEIDLS